MNSFVFVLYLVISVHMAIIIIKDGIREEEDRAKIPVGDLEYFGPPKKLLKSWMIFFPITALLILAWMGIAASINKIFY